MRWLCVGRRRFPRRVGPVLLSLVVLAILLLPAALGQDDAGIGAEARLLHSHWVVTWVAPGGVAARAGLREGDVIVALDGAAPTARRHTDPGLDLSATRTWGVFRHGMRLTLRPASEGAPRGIALDSLFLLGIALAFWGTGTVVRLIKPDDTLVCRFYYLCLAIAMAMAFGPAASADVLWIKALDVLSFALLPALFLSFFVWFAHGAPPAGWASLLVRSLYGGGIAAGSLTLSTGLIGSGWYDPVHTLLLVLLAVGFLGGLGSLVRGYIYPWAPHARRQGGIVLVGAAVAILPLTILCLIPESVGRSPLIHPQVAALSLVSLPLSVTYAILRHHLWDITIVGRTLVHAMMTLLLAGCYLVFFYEIEPMRLNQADQSNPLFFLAFFAAVAVTFIPVRDRVRQAVDHLLYGDRYDYTRTLRALGAQLASVRPLDEVLSVVAEGLGGALDVRGVAILLRNTEGQLVVRATSGLYHDAGVGQSLLLHCVVGIPHDDCARAGAGRWIPLSAHGEESGLLYLGPKRSLTDLSPAELTLAETIASQAAVTIANTLLVERLQAKVDELALLRDRLLHVQEAERKRLARDLHDGAYHTVLDVVRQAQLITQVPVPASAMAPHLYEGLSTLIERGQDAAYELRTVCATLYPSELADLGLVAALEYLARTTSRDENLVVGLDTKAFPTEQRLPREVEDTLYRVARQALDNVLRHAAAREATVTLALDEYQVVLTVRDDGQGFIMPVSSATLLRTGHLGLVSMRESIEGRGGTFSAVSAPGAGTEVCVCVSACVQGDAQTQRKETA